MIELSAENQSPPPEAKKSKGLRFVLFFFFLILLILTVELGIYFLRYKKKEAGFLKEPTPIMTVDKGTSVNLQDKIISCRMGADINDVGDGALVTGTVKESNTGGGSFTIICKNKELLEFFTNDKTRFMRRKPDWNLGTSSAQKSLYDNETKESFFSIAKLDIEVTASVFIEAGLIIARHVII